MSKPGSQALAPQSAPEAAAWWLRLSARGDLLISFAIAVGIVALAEALARAEAVSPLVLPAPSAVWAALLDGLSKGGWWLHIGSTILSMLSGFLIAICVAMVVAGVLASIGVLERIFTPFIVAFQSMPKIAIAPLVVIWLGFGDASKIAIVAISCFFPILVNTLQGLKVRDRDTYELMRSLGATRWQMFWRLRLPNSMPYFFVGLKVGMIFSLIGAVVAEFVGTASGVGFVMMQAKAQFDVPGMFACLIILMILGVVMHFLMARAESFASHWSADVSRASA
ncbi:MAG: ABC transporter permease [Burkholderiales bacterium]|nr:ABC transporter permease [Burkholderiales bacterium]